MIWEINNGIIPKLRELLETILPQKHLLKIMKLNMILHHRQTHNAFECPAN